MWPAAQADLIEWTGLIGPRFDYRIQTVIGNPFVCRTIDVAECAVRHLGAFSSRRADSQAGRRNESGARYLL
jgi:hypothetical protein